MRLFKRNADEKEQEVFYFLFLTVAVAAFCECFGVQLNGTGAVTRVLHTAIKAIELSIAPFLAILITYVIEKEHEKVIVIFFSLLMLFGIVMQVMQQQAEGHLCFYRDCADHAVCIYA